MNNLIWIFVLILLQSCFGELSEYNFPQDIEYLKVQNLSHYRGYITINDSVAISINYYKDKPYKENRNQIFGKYPHQLKVGDIIINENNQTPINMFIDIVKKKTGDTIRYYRYPYSEDYLK